MTAIHLDSVTTKPNSDVTVAKALKVAVYTRVEIMDWALLYR